MPSSPVDEHRQRGPHSVGCAVVTVSDTRSLEEDRGGALIVESVTSAGHFIASRTLVRDEPNEIVQSVRDHVEHAEVNAILITGGTGVARRDATPETIRGMLDREIPGFGELFRMLSFQQVGAAAMLSRALGGVIGETVVLAMPGSPAAVKLAMTELVLPELGHLVQQATS